MDHIKVHDVNYILLWVEVKSGREIYDAHPIFKKHLNNPNNSPTVKHDCRAKVSSETNNRSEWI